MIHRIAWAHPQHGDLEVHLRKPEPGDVDALYRQKNDPAVARMLGGFSKGYARGDLERWVEFHRTHGSEVLWAIAAETADGPCIGHVGLYEIDHRIRSAEFAVMIGDKGWWRRGLGWQVTRFAVDYGFDQLNLNRVHLTVLDDNKAARELYSGLGFVEEGVMRQAQYKDGRYLDVVVMSLLRDERPHDEP